MDTANNGVANFSSSPLSSLPSSVPSSPLSELSATPSPPPDDHFALNPPAQNFPWPSPPASQQTSQSGSPSPDSMRATDSESARPAKRRRISKDPKERTTETLDLRQERLDADEREQLDRLLHVLHKKQKIVVIAGAGISVSAGIPDFRSSHGLFRSLKEDYKLKGSGKDLFDASVYKDDSSTSFFHDMVSTMSRLTKDAKPTAFHHMLATIAQEDRLLRLYTQNVDGIDTSLAPLKTCAPLRKGPDGKWPRTVQLHGGLDKMVCSKCRELSDLDASLFAGPIPPLCPTCEEINDIRTQHEGKRSHGIGRLRPRMVLYNEHNPDDEAIGAVTKEDLRKRPDAVIVVGTTLKVPGVRRIVREMCGVVRDRRGGVAIWINNDPPPVSKDLEDCWDIIVRGPSDAVARKAAMRKWDEPVLPEGFAEVSDDDAHKAAEQALRPSLPALVCTIPHAKAEALPSDLHRNNSFKPPQAGVVTPVKRHDRGPIDWTPMTSRGPSVIASIENSIAGEEGNSMKPTDSIRISSGLPTPTKSQRNSPVSFTERLKAAKPSKPAADAKKSAKDRKAPVKKSNVKYVKSAHSQSKAKAKTNAKAHAVPKLTDTFKTSKGATNVGKKAKAATPAKAPSKLRQISNVSPEVMHPVSPQEYRNNPSPHQAESPDLKQPASPTSSENRMSISSVLN